ncbi:unnamed protein product, partial [Nesidiocoris tenuis]
MQMMDGPGSLEIATLPRCNLFDIFPLSVMSFAEPYDLREGRIGNRADEKGTGRPHNVDFVKNNFFPGI